LNELALLKAFWCECVRVGVHVYAGWEQVPFGFFGILWHACTMGAWMGVDGAVCICDKCIESGGSHRFAYEMKYDEICGLLRPFSSTYKCVCVCACAHTSKRTYPLVLTRYANENVRQKRIYVCIYMHTHQTHSITFLFLSLFLLFLFRFSGHLFLS
jgi:hypothetical protein